MLEKYQRVYAEINLDAIESNMNNMHQNLDAHTKMIGVIKTDAYGHGAVQIGKILEQMDFVFGYAVATAEEAMILRHEGLKKPILILGYTFPYSYEMMIQNDVRFTVFRYDCMERIAQCADRIHKKAKVHIKVDTGMSRIGITPDEKGIEFVRQLLKTDNLEIEGIFTHFSRADEKDKTTTEGQLEKFCHFCERIKEELDYDVPLKHCSNSASIIELPKANMDLVRAGITLYGLWPSEEVNRNIIELTPVLSLKSHVVYIKEVEAGTEIGYGGTYVAESKRRVATIPVGYGDGYPRGLSNKGYVLIHGQKAPILGRVCMDQFMVDITDIRQAQEGDEVILIGESHGEKITVEQLGEISGRFHYELTCDLGRRIPRVFTKQGKVVSTKDYYDDYR